MSLPNNGGESEENQMKSASKLITLLVIAFLFNTQEAPGFSIKLQKKVKLSQETTLLANPTAFCITEDELFIIPDLKVGDIKIYDCNGKLVNTLGRKGY
jgi:hypothetical protein